jgi:type VI secretion system secreted protein VgrG
VPFLPAVGEDGGLANTIWEWRERVSTTAQAKVNVRLYDFARPSAPVDRNVSGKAQHRSDELEIYDYVGDFSNDGVAETAGKMKLNAGRARRQVYHGVGDAAGLACGGLFSLAGADPSRLNQSYLIAGLRTELTAQSYRSNGVEGVRRVYIEAIPSSTEFRPAHRTPRPRATGPETATVVTPDGKPVYVDNHGRVRVRFHWDRRDKTTKGDDTCWLRVSHGAAGAGYGMVNLPRLNHEVIVDFLQGDPDRPIITGHVYDPDRPHPYGPDQNMTVSVWKTQTVGDAGDYDGAENKPSSATPGFNEIRLEDKGGSEEIYVHAQRAMVTDVLLDDKLTVQRDRATRIGRDRTTAVKNNETVTVEEGDETHTVSKGKRVSTIKANDELTVQEGDHKTTVSQGDQTTTVSQGNQTTTVSMGDITVKASMGQITIEAMQSITLKVGGNSVVIDQTGVTVKGTMVTSEAQAVHVVKGAMVQVEGSGMTTVKGGLVMIN